MEYKVGDIFYCDGNYPKRAEFCDKNGYIIKKYDEDKEGKIRYQICEVPPPSKEELLADLRGKREIECFSVINRGQLWYATLSDEEKEDLATWYQDWLDITEKFVDEESMGEIIPTRPAWLK